MSFEYSLLNLRRVSRAGVAFSLIAMSTAALAQTPRKTAPTAKQSTSSANSAKLDATAKQAEQARNQGEIPKAVELYQEVLKARPSWAEGWFYLGTMLYDTDQYAKAIPAFERLAKLQPKMGTAWAFLGLCEFEAGNLKSALPHLQMAYKLGVDEEGTSRVADYHLAILLNLNGKFEEAASVQIARFGQEQLTPQIATSMGMSLLHMQMLPTQLDISRKELVFTAGQALSRMAHKQFAEALELLQPLEKEYSDVPYLRYASALALVSLQRSDDALERLQSEIKIAPGNAEPYLLTAKIYLERNSLADALKAVQQAVVVQPKNPFAHSLLAECYARTGRRADAWRELAVAESLGLPTAAEKPGITKPNDASSAKPKGDAASREAEATDPKFVEIQQRISAARKANDGEAALEAYREGLSLRPEWAEGLLNVSTVYYTQGRYSEALELARRLVRVQSGVGTAWALLGMIEFQLGNYDDALVHLTRGRNLGFPPGGGAAISEANYHVGILLNSHGEFEPARTVLLQEAKGGPRAMDAKFALGIGLLRLRQLPSQIKNDQRAMVETAGDIAIDLSKSDYTPACAKFDELLKQYPMRPYIYNAYGWTLLSISRFDAAIEQYRKQLQVDPNAADAYLGLASAAIKLNKFEDGRDAAAKAVKLEPNSAMAHGQLGRAYVGLNELDKGITELETAVHLAVQIPELHYSLSRAYAKANRPKDAERERQIFLRLTKDANKK